MSSFIRRTFTTPDAQDADLILSTGGSRLQSFLMISKSVDGKLHSATNFIIKSKMS